MDTRGRSLEATAARGKTRFWETRWGNTVVTVVPSRLVGESVSRDSG